MIRHLILATLLVLVITLGLAAMFSGLIMVAFFAAHEWSYSAYALLTTILLVAITNWLMELRDGC